MSHWLECAIIGYLGRDPAKYRRALVVIAQRQAQLNSLGNHKDDWDYKGLEDCTNLAEFLTRHLAKLTATAPGRGINNSTN